MCYLVSVLNKAKSAGVYSSGEMTMMNASRKFRAWLFYPIVWILHRLRISANMVSFAGALAAIAGISYSLYFSDQAYFIGGLAVHILMDSLDGPLARFKTENSRRGGSIFDCACDHVGILSASIYLFYFSSVYFLDFAAVLLYTVFYTAIIFLSFILVAVGKPFRLVLRPRFWLYAAIIIDLFWHTNLTRPLLYILTVILFLQTIQGLFAINKHVSR